MTAPIWLASPPELHSALLNSGPGPGPLLASAGEWNLLSGSYAAAAAELSGLLTQVAAGAWGGASSVAYVVAHVPYLSWLMQASADSAANAAQKEAAAAAYTTALAAMPTLAELASNHAAHGVLTATNFFGINTIPIALNEADYVRMWIQAATVMDTYHVVSTAALVSSPQTPPAPTILKANGSQVAAAQAATPPPEHLNPFEQWLLRIYTDFYNNFLQPFVDWVANIPFLHAILSGIDPYLLILGNPLTYLSPANIAFMLGMPMDIGTYVTLLSQTFAFIASDLAAAFATGNPVTIGFTILFTSVEAIGTIITDTIALLKTLLEQTLALLPLLAPLLTSPLVASGAVLAPIGVTGLAAVASVPPPPPPGTPATPPLATLAPSVPTSAPAPAPTPVQTTVTTPTATPSPPPTSAPPSVTCASVGTHMDAFGYLVGDLSSTAKRVADNGARKKAPQPDGAKTPKAGLAPPQPRYHSRKRAKAHRLGRGYEYADPRSDAVPNPVAGNQRRASMIASDESAGQLGFVGMNHKVGAGSAAGLTALAGDVFDVGPRTPMIPSTWGVGPAVSGDLSDKPSDRAQEETDSGNDWRTQQRSVS
ncbi:PPE family protein [Mycobacterium sp.]|uniref:PPE family protein n=1 Tax=Mycobacterium sp. TaxID=1785 RepID=UPI003BA9A976